MSGTTADKLNYLRDTKELLREEINKEFSDSNLSPSDAFREYSSRISDSTDWLHSWISGGYVGGYTSSVYPVRELMYRTYSNISFPGVTSIPDINASSMFCIGAGHFYLSDVTNIQAGVTSTQSSSRRGEVLEDSVVEHLHLDSLRTIVGGEYYKGFVFQYAYPFRNSFLGDVYMPNVTSIGEYTFISCYVRALHIGTNLSTVCALNYFGGISSVDTIYVPSALVDSYKTANNWADYASRIYAEPGT